MPLGILDKGREKTTLVFDTWADVGAEPVGVRWACSLDEECEALLRELSRHLGYLGRSESWVIAEMVADDVEPPTGFEAFPHIDGRHPGLGWEQVSLMAAEEPERYDAWRAHAVAQALEPFPIPPGKKKLPAKLAKNRQKAVAPYPNDLLACLQQDTAWWKRHGWSQPPGARRVLYWRPSDVLRVGPVRETPRTRPRTLTTMLLALAPRSRSRSTLPLTTRTLPQAELIHTSLIAQLREDAKNCPELTGTDGARKPLTGHRHLHVLPVDLDDDGHIDHVILHAPMGLGPRAQHAVRSLKRTWTKGGVGELRVALAGEGGLDDLRRLPDALGLGVERVLGSREGSRVWRSATPFVAPRYPKQRGANTLEGQILAELASRGLPAARVEFLPWDDETRHLRHAVRARRKSRRPPPVDAGYALRLSFDEPIQGPLSLGYAAHFGLGLFVAVSADQPLGRGAL
jgi:CRISPR-associated protein Csb2